MSIWPFAWWRSGYEAPPIVTGVSVADQDYTTLRVSWSIPTGTFDGFRVYRSEDGLLDWSNVSGNLSAATSQWDDTVDDGVRWYYYVVTYQVDPAVESDPSAVVNDFTPLKPPVLSALSAGSPSYSAINTTHTDGGSASETVIRCYISSTGPSSGFSLKESFAANSTSGVISPLNEYTTYWVKLCNYNSLAGESAFSSVLSRATTLAPVLAPSGLTALAVCDGPGGADGYELDWTDNSSNEDGFTVYRRVYGDDEWVPRTNVQANQNWFDDYTGYTSTSNYEWAVSAYRNTPVFQESALATALGSNGIPDPPPAGVAGTPTDEGFNEIQVTFSGGAGADGWKIRRRIGTEGSGSQIESNYTLGSPYIDDDFPVITDGAPSNCNIINIQEDQFQVSWTEHPTLPGDQLVLDLKEGTQAWQFDHLTGLTASPATVTNLTPSTTYSVRVRYRSQQADPYSWQFQPFNECGDGTASGWTTGLTPWEYGPYSNTDTDTTSAPSPPADPSNPTITAVGPDDARYDWTDNSTDEDGFRVEYSLNFGQWTFVANKAPNVEFHVHNNIPGIQTGDDLQFRVRAEKTGGPYSNWVVSDPYIW